MGQQPSQLCKQLSELFDLPQDIILDLPTVAVVGNLNLKLENHRGIIKYKPDIIRIRVKHGQIIVRGRSLVIKLISQDQLIIVGKIDKLSFELL